MTRSIFAAVLIALTALSTPALADNDRGRDHGRDWNRGRDHGRHWDNGGHHGRDRYSDRNGSYRDGYRDGLRARAPYHVRPGSTVIVNPRVRPYDYSVYTGNGSVVRSYSYNSTPYGYSYVPNGSYYSYTYR